MKTKHTSKFFALLLAILMVIAIVPFSAITAFAANGTQHVTLVTSDGTSVGLQMGQYYNATTKSAEYSGSLDGTTCTAYLSNSGELELYNFTGKRISVAYPDLTTVNLIIKLKGTNTLSITDDTYESAIYNDETGDIKIYADEEATLDIAVSGSSVSSFAISTSVQSNVYSGDVIIGGKAKVSVNMTATDSKKAYGIYACNGSVSIQDDAHFSASIDFDSNYAGKAIWASQNITINTTGNVTADVSGTHNKMSSGLFYSGGTNTLTKVGTLTSKFYDAYIYAKDASPTWTYNASDFTVILDESVNANKEHVYKYGVAPKYAINMTNGVANPTEAAAGEAVTITANAAPAGQKFKEWNGADGLTFTSGSKTSATATFTMPANAVTLTATYENDTTQINAIDFTLSGYAIGNTRNDASVVANTSGITLDDDGSINRYAFYTATDTKLGNYDAFEANTTYKIKVCYTVGSGYELDAAPTLTLGDATFVSNTKSGNYYTATFTLPQLEVATNNLTGITVTTPPTKTAYVVGENFDKTGMVVTATYEDSSTAPITDYTITNGTALTAGQTTVTISYTENMITKTATVTITVHEHTYGDTFNGKDATNHWKECTATDCPDKEGSKKDVDSHSGGTATCVAKAVCSCGQSYGSIDATNHDMATEWTKTADGHYHVCKRTGCEYHDTLVAHTSSGSATETTPETCTVCGYVITPALGHTTHTPKTEWKSDADNHWHECTGCEGQQLDKAAHVDSDTNGKCDTCNADVPVAPPHTHTHGTTWKSDANNHWNECECGDKANVAAHADTNNDEKCDTCGYDMPASGTEPGTEPGTTPGTDDPNTPDDDKDGLGAGAIIGIVVGVLAVLGGGGFALYWFVLKKKPTDPTDPTTPVEEAPDTDVDADTDEDAEATDEDDSPETEDAPETEDKKDTE